MTHGGVAWDGRNWDASFRTTNAAGRFVRHKDSLGRVDPYSRTSAGAGDAVQIQMQLDSTFRIVPGLADSQQFSILPNGSNTHYLRHLNWRIRVDAYTPGDRQFEEDATFILTPGLWSETSTRPFSIRSHNAPNRYIRHRGFELWLDDFVDENLFRRDATFSIEWPNYVWIG